MPKFFDERYHLGLGHIGLPLNVVYNFSVIGSIGGGWLSTAFNKAGMRMAKARFSTAAHQGWSANLFTTASDIFSRSSVGAVVGVDGMAGTLGAVLFSLITGWVLQSYHSYAHLFSIAAASYLFGLLFLRIIAPGLQRVDVAVSPGAN